MEQSKFLKLAEEFAKLSEPECAKDLIEKVLAQAEKQEDLPSLRRMKQQCCTLLRRHGFEAQAAEIEEQTVKDVM